MTARFLIFLAAAGSLFAESDGYRIFSACDEHEDVRAEIQKDTPLRVEFSIAGGSVCYSVTATVGGNTVRGYVLNGTLDAVQAFDRARAKNDRESFVNTPIVSVRPPAIESSPSEKPPTAKQSTVKADPKPEKKLPPPPKMSM